MHAFAAELLGFLLGGVAAGGGVDVLSTLVMMVNFTMAGTGHPILCPSRGPPGSAHVGVLKA